ncbi:DUF1109 domain-containing protein [Sandarakinorhabdus sp.]|uniref:DUF1109 domain-containing protein n=1 Tax=Sandarakinorhabdus sp. TaxID=1916663 RepID=UPI00286E31D8|nr:DUF1109 domain-containing protein [Sandarakinorhabdus sp.]
MASDPFIDTLVGDLKPVSARSRRRDMLLLLGFGAVELLLVVLMLGMRPDMPLAAHDMAFWWKLAGLLAIFLLSGAALVMGLYPAGRLPRFRASLAGLVITLLLSGWLIDAAGRGDLAARLMPAEGLGCVLETLTAGLPMLVLVGWLAGRSAPTLLARTGLSAGLAAAAAGGLAFVLSCPHNDPLYVVVWYGGSMALLALVGWGLLPRLLRW